MKILFLSALLLLFLSCSQNMESNTNCDRLLSKEVNFNQDSLSKDLFQILNCSEIIDSFDIIYYSPYLLNTLIENFKQKTNYKNLLNDIEELKQDEKYIEMRDQLYPDYLLKRKVAKIETWDEDKKLFLKLGAPLDFIKGYKDFVTKNADGIKTHGILAKEYRAQLNK